MFSEQNFLESVAHEVHVCHHIYRKLTPEQLEYRPGESMRNSLELLRYLTYCGMAPIDAMVNNDWSRIGKYQEAASTMTAEEFPASMDRQMQSIREMVEGLSPDDLARPVTLPWGTEASLGESLVNLPLKFLSSYRLQLFVYAKASGTPNLSTRDAWLGQDTPQE